MMLIAPLVSKFLCTRPALCVQFVFAGVAGRCESQTDKNDSRGSIGPEMLLWPLYYFE
jgi:hypothetical protein